MSVMLEKKKYVFMLEPTKSCQLSFQRSVGVFVPGLQNIVWQSCLRRLYLPQPEHLQSGSQEIPERTSGCRTARGGKRVVTLPAIQGNVGSGSCRRQLRNLAVV